MPIRRRSYPPGTQTIAGSPVTRSSTLQPGEVGIVLVADASDTNQAFIRNAVIKGNTW